MGTQEQVLAVWWKDPLWITADLCISDQLWRACTFVKLQH